jgi:hypothetical protein
MSDQNPILERLHELVKDIPNDHTDQLGYVVPDPQVPFSEEGYRPAQPDPQPIPPVAPEGE